MSISFPLASMSPLIRGITILLLFLPLIFLIIGIKYQNRILFLTVLFFIAIYSFVWFCCRPSYFVVSNEFFQIVFPTWQRQIPLQNISNIKILDQHNFATESGWTMRIGAGGLWGGFGWLWTEKLGFLEFYVSKNDDFILIELLQDNNLLITPKNPEQMCETIREIIADENH